MSLVRAVVDWDRQNLDWLVTEDSDGSPWKYVQKSAAPDSAPQDVEWNGRGTAPVFVRNVQQDEPGLPKKIVASLLLSVTGGPARGPAGNVIGKYEYEQE